MSAPGGAGLDLGYITGEERHGRVTQEKSRTSTFWDCPGGLVVRTCAFTAKHLVQSLVRN